MLVVDELRLLELFYSIEIEALPTPPSHLSSTSSQWAPETPNRPLPTRRNMSLLRKRLTQHTSNCDLVQEPRLTNSLPPTETAPSPSPRP